MKTTSEKIERIEKSIRLQERTMANLGNSEYKKVCIENIARLNAIKQRLAAA